MDKELKPLEALDNLINGEEEVSRYCLEETESYAIVKKALEQKEELEEVIAILKTYSNMLSIISYEITVFDDYEMLCRHYEGTDNETPYLLEDEFYLLRKYLK